MNTHTVINMSTYSDKILHGIKNAIKQFDVLLDTTPHLSKIQINILLFLFNITKKLLKWRYNEIQDLLEYMDVLELKIKHGKLIELIEKIQNKENIPLDVCILIETITGLITKYNLRLKYYIIDYSTHSIGIYIHIVLYFDIKINKYKLKQFKYKLGQFKNKLKQFKNDKTNDFNIELYKDIDDEHYIVSISVSS